MDSRWRNARRVLVVRLDNLGDVLLATPAIRALRRALPRAHLTLLASPAGAPVAPLDPDLDSVLVYQAPWMDPDRQLPQDPSREASTIAEVRRRGYDAAVIFTSYHQSPLPAAYLCYLAGVPLRHAASLDGPGSLLTSRHRHPDRALHEVERGLDLVAGIGVEPAGDDLVLQPRAVDLTAMGELVARQRVDGRPVVVIHPGCRCPSRTYPPEQFAAVAVRLSADLGARIIWTGSADEANWIERLRAKLAEPGVSLAGRTSLSELAALLAASDTLVTNNTGPMHVAAAVKTPVAALFALTNPPEQWHPWRTPYRLLNRPVPCAICYQRVCPHQHECLRGVSPDDVVRAVPQLIEEKR